MIVNEEFLIKKVKENTIRSPKGNRKVLELQVRNERKNTALIVVLHRGTASKLKAIELQKEKTRESIYYYEMRKGKSVVAPK